MFCQTHVRHYWNKIWGEKTAHGWIADWSIMLTTMSWYFNQSFYFKRWYHTSRTSQEVHRGELRSCGYSRQNSKSDQSDSKAEDGNGAANVSDGWQCRSVASGELCKESNGRHGNPQWKVGSLTLLFKTQPCGSPTFPWITEGGNFSIWAIVYFTIM